MKRMLSLFVCVLVLMATAGLSLAESGTTSADAATSATQAPGSGETRLMGTVTAVDTTAMTITVTGMLQQGGGSAPQQPSASGTPDGNTSQGGSSQQGSGSAPQQPSASGAPDGNAPQGGGNSQQGSGSAPQQPSGNGTQPEQQTITFTVTDTTVMTASDGTTAITLADLSVDAQVSVTFSGDATNGYTALTIQAMPAQPVAQATDATGNTTSTN